MPASRMSEVIQHLRRAVLLRDGTSLTDGQLLEDYISRRDEAALAALVRRHGPMVWGVCRRLLCNYHDAEDAFQATFLVLVRKAASIMPREMVANWLYGVAHQTALKARATTARRKGRERQVARMPEPAVGEQDLWRDLQPLLDQELSRLPDKYRAVIVLCDLEGKTRKEAARQLGVPEGTVAGQLARARTMLAKRMARHGLAVSGGALAALLTEKAASASVPSSVVSSTIKAVTLVAAGQTAATGAISVKVAALTEGVLKTMLLTKLKIATAGLLVAALTLACGAGLIYQTQAAEPSKPPQADKQPTAAKKDEKPKSDKERLQGTWKIVSCIDDSEKETEDVGDEWTIKETTIKAVSPAKQNSGAFTAYLRFRLDETTNPKLIDLVEGKAHDLFDTAKFDKRLDDADERKEGIYSLAGDTLKVCFSRKKGERPTAFESKKGSDYILYVLQRQKSEEKGDKHVNTESVGQAAESKKEAAPSKSDETWGIKRGRHEPQVYKAFFIQTLGVMAEYFEDISHANQYDGRIEGYGLAPALVKGQLVTRQAFVSIQVYDDSSYSITVRINKTLAEGTESKPVGRDIELERTILKRLNIQPSQKQKESLPGGGH